MVIRIFKTIIAADKLLVRDTGRQEVTYTSKTLIVSFIYHYQPAGAVKVGRYDIGRSVQFRVLTYAMRPMSAGQCP